MSQVNYAAMSTLELKQYLLKHRGDRVALQAYLDRRHEKPLGVITTVQDPEFDSKIQRAARQQMAS